jgi:predicted dehydrogenase
MGRRHVQAVQQLGLDLVGVFDKAPESLAAAAAECGVPAGKLFSEADAMYASAVPECVIIATTTDSHHDFVCQAIRGGARYILCEKPMASSLAQCDAMIEACRQNGIALAVNHHFRFAEVHRNVKQLLDSDDLGGLTSMTVVAGNVGMAMIGTHMFELFRFLSGEEPQAVTAWLSESEMPNPRGPQFEDRSGAIRIETKNGRRFYMEAGPDQGHGILVTYGAVHGQLVLDLLQGSVQVTRRSEADRTLPSTRYGTASVRTCHQYIPADPVSGTKAVLTHLLGGEQYPSGAAAREALAVLIAAYVSNEKDHSRVQLSDPLLPLARKFPWP